LFGEIFFKKEKNIVLTSVCPTLKGVVTSEMLFEEDKLLMEKNNLSSLSMNTVLRTGFDSFSKLK
jgi:hypothetical protein